MMDLEQTDQQQSYSQYSAPLLVLNPGRKAALEMWLKMTNLKLTQVNGQRRYGGPPQDWTGPAPCGGCEVFISHIPRDHYEDVLIPLFASVGPLWEFRLMMNFSGQNRGFAYAKYSTPELASAAVRSLHGHQLEEGGGVDRLRVRHSTEKKHLCLEPFPIGMGREDLLKVLRRLSEGAESVTLKGTSALVAYSSHHTASMAKKVLVEAFKKNYDVTISVKWHTAATPSALGWVATPREFRGLLATAGKSSTSESRASTPRLLLRSQSAPQAFSRAVGGPVANPPVPRRPTSCCSMDSLCQGITKPPTPPRRPTSCCSMDSLCQGITKPPTPPQRPTSCCSMDSLCQGITKPPTPPQRPTSCCSMDSLCQGIAAIAMSSPTVLLGRVCELYGLGQPRYEIQYSATRPNGYLQFTYAVHISGHPFNGTIVTLPGPSAEDTAEDARCAVAKRVLEAVHFPPRPTGYHHLR